MECFFVVVAFLVLCCASSVQCAEDTCYTPGSVAGIVIATVVVTIVTGGLAAAVIWHLWKQRKAVNAEKQSYPKNITCPPMSPDKKPIVRDVTDYAFDNPYFKDDEVDGNAQDAAEKGESGYHGENGDATGTQNSKQNGQKAKKMKPFSNLPFHAVFHPSGKKQRATMDDTYISKHLERVVVPLRGHDFTGLGFNICGNMRDGIFVKDVLHRGPASESGKIKSGDRIVGVTVSFTSMVYEDALTILSYASPYDVKLEIEKPLEAPTASPKRLAPPSTSFRGGNQRNRLFHPLYRSQSIDDLTQIGKDNFLAGKETTGSQRESSSSTPKRSQSIEAGAAKSRAFPIKIQGEASPKAQPEGGPKSRKTSTSSRDSGSKGSNAPTDDRKPAAEPPKTECKKAEPPKSSRFRVEQSATRSEAPAVLTQPPTKPARDAQPTANDQPPPLTNGQLPTEPAAPPKKEDILEVVNGEAVPTAPPRKMSATNGKRKAPAPPPAVAPRTEAVVHRADEKTADSAEQEAPAPSETPPPPIDAEDSSTSQMSLDSGQSKEEEEPSSPGKRKASSLGDLTTLEQGVSKGSAVLERAVSLDLQQNLPGENLMKQKKILRAPAFEDYDEGHEEDHSRTDEAPTLKRWEEGLDKVLTNGTHAVESFLAKEVLNGHHDVKEILIDDTFDLEFDPPDIPTSSTPKMPNLKDFSKLEDIKDFGKFDSLKDFPKLDDDSLVDDVPYLASSKSLDLEPTIVKQQVKGSVSVSIPVIKPDMTHFDKLPSPPPANTHPSIDQSWRITTSSNARQQEDNRPALERLSIYSPSSEEKTSDKISVYSSATGEKDLEKPSVYSPSAEEKIVERLSLQSFYSPVFQKTEKLVNGTSDLQDTTSDQHSTTVVEQSSLHIDNNSSSANSSSILSVTVTSKASPSGAAGFAKTLIVPGAGPSEVEDLLRLATVDDVPKLVLSTDAVVDNAPTLDPPKAD